MNRRGYNQGGAGYSQGGVYVPRRNSNSDLVNALSGNYHLTPGEQISKMAMDSSNFGSGYAGAWGAVAQGLTAGIGAYTQKKEQDAAEEQIKAYQQALADNEEMQNQALEEHFSKINPDIVPLVRQASPETKQAILQKTLSSGGNSIEPLTQVAKLGVDLKNGLIDPQTYKRAIDKETRFAADGRTQAPSGYRYTKDGSLESIPGGPADNKKMIEMERDNSQLAGVMQNLDAMQANVARLKSHPGLSGITGIRGALPNVPGTDAADAQAEADTLRAKTFVNAITAMRAASKTGAAVGTVSDKEGDKLQNSFEALNKSQSTKQFKENLDRLYQDIETSKSNFRSSYDRKYGLNNNLTQQPQQSQPQQQSFNGFKVLRVRSK